MINWLHTFNPDPILIKLGIVQVHWYGLFMLLAITAGFLIVLKLAPSFKIKKDLIWDVVFWLVIGSLLGARVYEVLVVDFSYYFTNPENIFKIWHGGLAIHGVWLGGLFVLYIFARKYKLKLLKLLDLLSIGLILGQAIGRWGNYFNQELYGLPTKLVWGIPIELVNRVIGFEQYIYFHPTFLYESLGNLLIFGLLLLVYKYYKYSGQIFFTYLALYSSLRMSLEFIRLDETLIIFGLRWPLLFSGILVIISIAGLFLVTRNKDNKIV